jgi:hypothetical protein
MVEPTREKYRRSVGRSTLSAAVLSIVMLGVSSHAAAAQQKPAKDETQSGVTVLKRGQCDDGYRLYSSRQTEVAHLIDLDGRQVHRWAYPQGKTWHYAELLPNGHLVAIIKDVMILELDWDGKLVWKAELRAHHDFARLPHGNTFIAESNSGRTFEVTPEGEIVWEFLNPDVTKAGQRMALYRTVCYPRSLVERLLEEHD